MWDRDVAVAYLNSHASLTSHGRCAEYVRKAIEAGGVVLVRPVDAQGNVNAKDYGASVRAVGFVSLGQLHANYLAGDVAIVDAITGHPAGHMAMFNGEQWVSDFKQQHGLYPGAAYRSTNPPFTIYRYVIRWDSAAPPSSLNLA